jgi:uncharacterized membrane protein
MNIARTLRHLFTTRWQLRRAFGVEVRKAIEAAIREGESTHRGELRFAVEASLSTAALIAGETADERALDVFANLGIWDTEDNSGILIYVLLADHHVAIVADRGYRGRVTHEQWQAICQAMEASFRQGDFRAGAVEGIRRAATLAAEHFPLDGPNPNELSDEMVLL